MASTSPEATHDINGSKLIALNNYFNGRFGGFNKWEKSLLMDHNPSYTETESEPMEIQILIDSCWNKGLQEFYEKELSTFP